MEVKVIDTTNDPGNIERVLSNLINGDGVDYVKDIFISSAPIIGEIRIIVIFKAKDLTVKKTRGKK